MTDRVGHDEKAGDEMDANNQGPDERDPVGFYTVCRGLFPPALLPKYAITSSIQSSLIDYG